MLVVHMNGYGRDPAIGKHRCTDWEHLAVLLQKVRRCWDQHVQYGFGFFFGVRHGCGWLLGLVWNGEPLRNPLDESTRRATVPATTYLTMTNAVRADEEQSRTTCP